MKYPIRVWRFWPSWCAIVELSDIPLAYYPRCNPIGRSFNQQKAVDRAIALRQQALLNFERGRRQDKPVQTLEVEVQPPAQERGPVWR